MRVLVDERLDEKLEARFKKEREYTRSLLDERFAQEREYTRQMMTDTFLSFWESNLEPAFESLETEVKKQGRLLARHSNDIMELRSRTT